MKTAVLIDGGHLRACAKAAGKVYDNKLIEDFARSVPTADEYLLRIYYYDSPQYRGKQPYPVSGKNCEFKSNDRWLQELACLERFAVRRGTLGFRGWRPKATPLKAGAKLTDNDFSPIFEQKGVDMRIGLDIATFAERRSIDRMVLISADTDMIPAMKHARKAGIEVVVGQLPAPAFQIHSGLSEHSDFVRPLLWP